MSKRSMRSGARSLLGLFALLGVCLALVLAGCGATQQDGAKGAQQEGAAVEGAFAGREKRDPAELDEFVEKALGLGEERKSSDKGEEEGALTVEQADAFKEANEAYRAGEYETAQKGYEEVIEAFPEHYGANVNLTLALLQQEKNDDALIQALACMALYPDDDGPLLNVQTAAVACGFSAENALEEAALVVVRKVQDGAELSEGMKAEMEYNKLWDDIETALHDVAQGTATNGEYVYDSLRAAADELADGDLADDEDAQALRAYLIAVGTQLGLEDAVSGDAGAADADKDKSDPDKDSADGGSKADKDKAEDKSSDTKASANKNAKKEAEDTGVDLDAVEAHVGLPYVVADDEVCTIVFTGYHMGGDNPVAEFQFVNHTDERLYFSAAHDVTANGKTIENLSAAWPTIDGAGQESAWGSFFGKEGDKVVSVIEGDLKQLSCAVKVTAWGSEPKAMYPLKWEADPKQAKRELEGKLIDDEGGVSLTLQKVLPASDGIVAVEYQASYKGEGHPTIDGDEWTANGKEVECLSNGSPLGTATFGNQYLLFRAKDAGDLRGEDIESLEGILAMNDAEGKKIVNQKLTLSFDK